MRWFYRHKYAFFAISALMIVAGCATETPSGPVRKWAAYYDDDLPASTFKDLDLVVFDRRHHPDIKPLKGKTRVLAYISIGEAHDEIPEKADLAKEKALLSHNKQWNSHVVDLASPLWRRLVLNAVDDAARQGFDGVMLDTVDSPLHWAGKQDINRLYSMRKAAAELIHEIRYAHPNLKLMLNRGFELLPRVNADIDYILAESIMVETDISAGQFRLFPSITHSQAATQLQQELSLAPHLQVMTLDYWNQNDGDGIEHIYAAQRQHGFVPYVATPDLRRFVPEPAAL